MDQSRISPMQSFFASLPICLKKPAITLLILGAVLGFGRIQNTARAQSGSGGCVLNDHIYTCDGPSFQKALGAAKTVAIQTHNADGVARNQLTTLLTSKFGKTIALPDAPPDLTFLLIPIDQAGNINH